MRACPPATLRMPQQGSSSLCCGVEGSGKNQQGSVNTLWAVKGSVGLSGEATHSPGALTLWAAGRSGQGGRGAALVILTVQSVTEGIFTLRYFKIF